tara:strand:+ start:642 stop:857 length:216 start_codon:yes stop_codon:yes gene_type:complete
MSYKYEDKLNWQFPYKGIHDPKYIKDKSKTFISNGHGWWWSEGKAWEMSPESPMEWRNRIKKEKENEQKNN